MRGDADRAGPDEISEPEEAIYDEYVEATPNNLRLRKRILNATLRKRAAQAAKAGG